jgi:hypothetical protein
VKRTLFVFVLGLLLSAAVLAQTFSATPAQNQGLPSDFTLTAAGQVCVGSAGACNSNNISANDIGTWVFSVYATDSLGNKSPVTPITLTIGANCVITITPTTLGGGVVGKPYSQQLTATGTGGCGSNFTFSLASTPSGGATPLAAVPGKPVNSRVVS